MLDIQGLIQSLSQNRRPGQLTVIAGEERRGIRFVGGQLAALTGSRIDAFPRALCWAGVISRAQINTIAESLGADAGPDDLLHHLVDHGILVNDAILDAIDLLIEEEFTTLVRWPRPVLSFSEAMDPDPWADVQQALGVSLSASALLLEALRRQDELTALRSHVPHAWDALIRESGVALPSELSNDAKTLMLELRDGTMVLAITEGTRLPPYRATMAVTLLRRAGLVRIATAAELSVMADAARAQGAQRRAYLLYRRSRELGQGGAKLHLHVGELAEMFGDHALAAEACVAAASELTEPQAAVLALENALRLGADPERPLTDLIGLHLQLAEGERACARLIELARLYERRRAFDQAVQALGEAQELGADPAVVAVQLARIATAQGEREQAVLHLEVAARAFHESERISEAATAWREIVRQAPHRVDYARECAELLVWDGDRDGAVAALRAAINAAGGYAGVEVLLPAFELLARLDPGDVSAHDWLAGVYATRRDRDGAAAQLRLAAEAQERAGDLMPLAETLERIVELNGQEVETLAQLAQVRLRLGQESLAEQAWAKAADAAIAQGDRRIARSILDQGVMRLPASAALRSRLALVANRDGDRVVAIRNYSCAADLARGSGDAAQAREMLAQLSRLRPEDLMVRTRLAEVATELKDPQLDRILADTVTLAQRTSNLGIALDHARQRAALSAADTEARQVLVELLRRTGDHAGEMAAGQLLLADLIAGSQYRQAVMALEQLIGSHPANADLLVQLAEVHGLLSDRSAAARIWRQAILRLQMDGRLEEARAHLEALRANGEDADLVQDALAMIEAGQAIDWDKLRQEARRRLGETLAHDPNATKRPITDRHRKLSEAIEPDQSPNN